MRTFTSHAVSAAFFGVCAVCSGQAAATDSYAPPPFGHYQPILDRMPFGSLPTNFGQVPVDPAAAQTAAQLQAEQQKLAKQINMSAVNITPEGKTAIGFTDLSAKPPVNYYLLVGTSADGWQVISADYDDEVATLEKDGVSITLQLGKGLVDPSTLPAKQPAVPAAPAGVAAGVPPPGSMMPGLGRRGAPNPLSGANLAPRSFNPTAKIQVPALAAGPAAGKDGDIRSYKERLLERKTQQTEADIAAAKRQRELLEKLAREVAKKEIAKREEEAAQAAAAEPAMDAQPQEAPPQEGVVQ